MPDYIVVARPKHGLTQRVSAPSLAEAIDVAKATPNNWELPTPDQKDWSYEVQEVSPNESARNPFHDAENISQLLGRLGGATSMCWENPGGAGVFEADRASYLVDLAFERLKEILSSVIS